MAKSATFKSAKTAFLMVAKPLNPKINTMTLTPSGYSPMINAPIVAIDIKKNSVKASPFIRLFHPSLITRNPTGI